MLYKVITPFDNKQSNTTKPTYIYTAHLRFLQCHTFVPIKVQECYMLACNKISNLKCRTKKKYTAFKLCLLLIMETGPVKCDLECDRFGL